MKEKKTNAISNEIIKRAQRGDIAAFEEIVYFYDKRIYFFCHRYLSTKEDIEDLSQDTFMKIFRNINRYNFKSAFSTWVFTITKHTVYDFLRKKRRSKDQVKLDDLGFEFGIVSTDSVDHLHSKIDIELALQKIKPNYKKVLELFYWRGFGYGEIAKTMKIPVNTVKTYMARAKKSILDHLKIKK